MTDPAEIASYTSGVLRARADYYADHTHRKEPPMNDTPMTAGDYSLMKNAERYQYDAQLDPIADQMDAGDTAWTQAHPVLQDRAGVYRALRTAHRQAIKAGLITNTQETR